VEAPILILASASLRRARILRELGVPFRTVVSGQDEAVEEGEDGATTVERLARAKALAVAEGQALPVLGADTAVLCDDEILGKPTGEADAVAMLRRLSRRAHEVVTGVCLVHGTVVRSGIERTRVTFGEMSDDEVEWYVATGEPLDKAGAYNIAGRGALFIESVEGSPSNVAGLPVSLLRRLAAEAGVALGWPLP
jgi:septum formation protein